MAAHKGVAKYPLGEKGCALLCLEGTKDYESLYISNERIIEADQLAGLPDSLTTLSNFH